MPPSVGDAAAHIAAMGGRATAVAAGVLPSRAAATLAAAQGEQRHSCGRAGRRLQVHRAVCIVPPAPTPAVDVAAGSPHCLRACSWKIASADAACGEPPQAVRGLPAASAARSVYASDCVCAVGVPCMTHAGHRPGRGCEGWDTTQCAGTQPRGGGGASEA
eukprot:358454-Chlamydomonas_euryale.AAC.8